jgi:hypothetical protein
MRVANSVSVRLMERCLCDEDDVIDGLVPPVVDFAGTIISRYMVAAIES